MLVKRIFLTLATTAVFVTSAAATRSAGRKSSTVNKPVLAVSNSQKVKGIESVVNNGDGTTSGTITRGGKLNGTVQEVFTSMFTPSPDPSTFSFTDDLTLTTNAGVLKTHNVTIFDTATDVFSAVALD